MIERYRKLLRRRCAFNLAFGGLGVVLLVLLASLKAEFVSRTMHTFLFATGLVSIWNGMVNFFRNVKRLKDPDALQKGAVLSFDERNLEIGWRSSELALNVMFVIGYFAMIVSAFFDQTVCITLLVCLGGGLFTQLVCYGIVWKMH